MSDTSVPSESGPAAYRCDYDDDPDRFRTGRAVALRYGPGADVHDGIAERLVAEGMRTVLDVGAGEGALGHLLLARGVRWVGLDLSATLLAGSPRPVVRADATLLPFPDASFDAVTALYMLYHLPEPERAVAEAYRVLRPGGLFAAAAPSRHDSPEVAHLMPPSPPATFDAEIAPDLIGRLFETIEVDAWDGPYITLPDAEALRRYLIGRMGDPALAARGAPTMPFPLTITKRGAIVYGRK